MGEVSSVQEYEVEEVSERESEGVTRVGERGAKILCCYRNSNTSTAAGSPARPVTAPASSKRMLAFKHTDYKPSQPATPPTPPDHATPAHTTPKPPPTHHCVLGGV